MSVYGTVSFCEAEKLTSCNLTAPLPFTSILSKIIHNLESLAIVCSLTEAVVHILHDHPRLTVQYV